MGSRVKRTYSKAVAGRPGETVACGLGGPTFNADKPGGATGDPDRPCNPGFQ